MLSRLEGGGESPGGGERLAEESAEETNIEGCIRVGGWRFFCFLNVFCMMEKEKCT